MGVTATPWPPLTYTNLIKANARFTRSPLFKTIHAKSFISPVLMDIASAASDSPAADSTMTDSCIDSASSSSGSGAGSDMDKSLSTHHLLTYTPTAVATSIGNGHRQKDKKVREADTLQRSAVAMRLLMFLLGAALGVILTLTLTEVSKWFLL